MEYQQAIDVVESRFPSMVCQTNCCDCRIPILTSASNQERTDIRCLLGCRQHHQVQSSNQRSTEFNRSEKGRAKKKEHNRRRSLRGPNGRSPERSPQPTPKTEKTLLTLRERYYRWLIYLINGIVMNHQELRQFLERIYVRLTKKVRQQGLDKYNEVRNNRDD